MRNESSELSKNLLLTTSYAAEVGQTASLASLPLREGGTASPTASLEFFSEAVGEATSIDTQGSEASEAINPSSQCDHAIGNDCLCGELKFMAFDFADKALITEQRQLIDEQSNKISMLKSELSRQRERNDQLCLDMRKKLAEEKELARRVQKILTFLEVANETLSLEEGVNLGVHDVSLMAIKNFQVITLGEDCDDD